MKKRSLFSGLKISLYALLALAMFNIMCKQPPPKTYLFVGTYTDGEDRPGIYVYEFGVENGELIAVAKVEDVVNPSYLDIAPNGKYVYACTETKMERNGSVSAFSLEPSTGQLSFINKQDAGGRNPCHLSFDQTGKYVVSANYTDASVSVFEYNEDGSLKPASTFLEFEGSSVMKGRQDEAHAHSAYFSPDNNYIFSPDLGSDKIRALQFDGAGTATMTSELTVNTAKGSGPRHFAFHPNGKFGYCIEELGGHVTAYAYQNGKLDSLSTYFAYSKEQESYGSADIHISPDGKFLYASNRWVEENTIVIFKIDQATGLLTFVGHQNTHGAHPRNFTLDPSGQYLLVANQHSNSVIVFKRDMETGLLTKTDTELSVPSPSCVKMRTYGG